MWAGDYPIIICDLVDVFSKMGCKSSRCREFLKPFGRFTFWKVAHTERASPSYTNNPAEGDYTAENFHIEQVGTAVIIPFHAVREPLVVAVAIARKPF